MQIILIDDRCNDGIIDAAVISAKNAASELEENLQVNDRRESNPRMQSGSFRLTIDIYQSTKAGVASALNLGLKNSRFQYVARMDIDDISTSQRFARQIEYLQRYPELVAIGTHSMVFSSMKESESLTFRHSQVHKLPWDVEESGCWKVRPSWTPVDPAFTTWALLFKCCISHPSVLYRETDILSAGGYDEKLEHTEDYDLWRLESNICRLCTIRWPLAS
jgi:glycosyltransferase involved in cell wall biosynthesis